MRYTTFVRCWPFPLSFPCSADMLQQVTVVGGTQGRMGNNTVNAGAGEVMRSTWLLKSRPQGSQCSWGKQNLPSAKDLQNRLRLLVHKKKAKEHSFYLSRNTSNVLSSEQTPFNLPLLAPFSGPAALLS